MNYSNPTMLVAGLLCTGALSSSLIACDSDTVPAADADVESELLEGLNTSYFLDDGLVSAITEVDCTLSDGTETRCHKIAIKGAPSDHDIGPFCPRNITDGKELVGIWLESGTVYDATGEWISNLAEFYNDDEWQLYDETTGVVRVTETQEACAAAARPDVDEEYQNYCVECSIDYVDGGISQEFLIPINPKAGTSASEIGGMSSVGVALNGAHFDPPAPVADILSAHTIAAFDDCGGHVNLATGYHYHAATGCSESISQDDGHAGLIGYALDGYAIHSMAGEDGVEASDLDACRGHVDNVRGYHYHSASAGENMFIGCFRGLTVEGVSGVDPGGPGGDSVLGCDEVPAGSPCCGDAVCDGPETAANCAADCS